MHQPPQSLSIRDFLRFPAVDLEAVGHDARAGLELLEFGLEPPQVVRQQEKGENGRLRNVGLEHVALDELRLVGDARGRVSRAIETSCASYSTPSARAPVSRQRHIAPVARAEVYHEVLGGHLGHVEHLLGQGVGWAPRPRPCRAGRRRARRGSPKALAAPRRAASAKAKSLDIGSYGESTCGEQRPATSIPRLSRLDRSPGTLCMSGSTCPLQGRLPGRYYRLVRRPEPRRRGHSHPSSRSCARTCLGSRSRCSRATPRHQAPPRRGARGPGAQPVARRGSARGGAPRSPRPGRRRHPLRRRRAHVSARGPDRAREARPGLRLRHWRRAAHPCRRGSRCAKAWRTPTWSRCERKARIACSRKPGCTVMSL